MGVEDTYVLSTSHHLHHLHHEAAKRVRLLLRWGAARWRRRRGVARRGRRRHRGRRRRAHRGVRRRGGGDGGKGCRGNRRHRRQAKSATDDCGRRVLDRMHGGLACR